jgi:lysophospholipase L1-like esterase
MRRPLLLAVSASLTLAGVRAGADPVSLPAAAADVRYEGRTSVAADGAVWMAYPAVTVHLRFRGEWLALRALATKDTSSFDVAVDGRKPVRVLLPAGEARTLLWSDPQAHGVHEAEVVRRTEAWMGLCALRSFESPGGFLPPPQAPERRLLFIGDSFTCGASTEVRDGVPMEGKTLRQNARLSYGWILSRRLGSQCCIVGCGGRGLLRDWQGLRTARLAPEYYDSVLPDDPSSRWDPLSYVPDGVCICLGTNDFDEGIPDQTDFVRTYSGLVEKIRHDAPHAEILLVDSPILLDRPGDVPKHTVLHAYLEQVVQRLADPGVRLAPIHTYPIIEGDGHPNGAAHGAVADELEPQLREALGWAK